MKNFVRCHSARMTASARVRIIAAVIAVLLILGVSALLIARLCGNAGRGANRQVAAAMPLTGMNPEPATNLSLPDAADSDLAALKDKKRLRTLNLAGNRKVTDAGLVCLKEMTGLRTLDLSDTQVTDAGVAQLKELKGLQSLNLDHIRLTDAGLACLNEMEGLCDLHLAGTLVTDAGLAQLKGAKALQHLDLSNTLVTDAGLVCLKEMKGLRGLCLSATRVTDAGLAQLEEMKSLQELRLSRTRVTDAGLAQLKEMKELRSLALEHTQVTDAGLAQLKDMENLRDLYLAGTQVTDDGLVQMKDMTGLQRLDLSNTRMTSAGLEQLKKLTGLQYLALENNRVKNAGLVFLRNLNGLQTLDLAHTHLNDAGLAGLAYLLPLKDLQSLDLSSTPVMDAGLEYLKQLSGLRRLNLSDTLVTDAALAQLEQMKGLQSLNLAHTRMTDAAMAELRATLPQAQITPSTAFAESGASSAPATGGAGYNTAGDNTEWFAECGWGVFCHWLGDSVLTVEEWNHRVDAFDAKGLADQLAAIGAPYFVITIGQNSGYYLAPNATYDKYVGIQPSKCSRRDLVSDLYDCLHPRGIELLVYLPSGAPSNDPVAVERLGWEDGFVDGFGTRHTGKRLAEFQRKWEDVIREWSTRWGPKVRGWWIDGCYFADEMYRHNDEPNFRSFAAALKAGNPDALVAFNTGDPIPAVCTTEYEDFVAGETSWLPDCTGPWVARDGHKARYHVLSYLGQWWDKGEPRFPDELVAGYTKYVITHGGVITWDVPLQPSGRISPLYLKQLTILSRSLPGRRP